jgi:hypothetical protein
MRQSVSPLFLLAIGLAVATATSGQTASGRLQPDEYDAVALIYNQELSALGDKALYPICLNTPSDTPSKPLLDYLRKGGYAVNDLSLCQPNAGPGGNHPKDYPHGMLIFIDKPKRDSKGQVDMHVESTDLTPRPGEHLAVSLRRGTYHFKQDEKGGWQVSGYTKEYDAKDEKQPGCNVAESAPPNR